jgi:protocatechuate 3,4-dioxygenase beta subunit
MIADGADFRLVRASVLDTDGQPITGKTVSFSTTAGQFQSGAVVTNSALTNDNGVAQLNFVAPNTLGSATLRASVDGVTSNTITATFTPGAPANMILAAAPLQLQPGGDSTLTARVTDANNFPVAGQTVTFTFTQQGSGIPSVTPAFPQTDANGQVTVTYTAGASGGTVAAPNVDIIQAQTTNGVTKTVNIAVASDAVVVSNLILTATATSTQVGTSVGLTAKVTTASGTPELIPVNFTLSNGLASINASANTNINGEAIGILNAGTTIGSVTVTATASGFSAQQTIALTAGPPTSITLSAAPNPVTVASPQNKNQSDIVATVKDSNGNPVSGERVNFSIFLADNKTGGSVSATATTNLAGIARAVYSAGGTPGTDTITAEATSQAISQTVTVTADPDPSKVASILIVPSETVLPSTGTATLLVTARDSSGI